MDPNDPSWKDTLATGTTTTVDGSTEPHVEGSAADDALAGYVLLDVIGRGGMGEVVLARDRRIGRDVAIKRMRTIDPSEDDIRRFMREAKIQARLDHPAIVPVHELGRDANGHPYFTMKRLAGSTLAELAKTETLQRLLRGFVDVALAVGFAHSRGVIHRDLKPANIMLGDFGEVYVLDWGLARVIEGHSPSATIGAGADPFDPIESIDAVTMAGAMLGTPGYMSPEQVRDAASVDRPTDAYALGAILFELLANEPLHPRGPAAIASTLDEIETSPASRCPDRAIPPELDALCVAALATDPAERPSARMLGERVQSFLDGDRDVALRRQMARDAVGFAQAELAQGRSGEAMRAAGRALALDPTSPAAEIVTRLMLEPAKEPPPGLRDELDAATSRNVSQHARGAVYAYCAFFLFLPIAAATGVKSWTLILSIGTLAIVLAAAAAAIARRPKRSHELWFYALGNAAMLGLVGRVCGPFIMAPALASVIIASLVTYPVFRRTWLLIAGVVAGWMIPIILEVATILRPTWSVERGALAIQSYAIEINSTTMVFVFGVSVATMVAAATLASMLTRANQRAQVQLVTQAWYLSQLLPKPVT